MMGEGEGTPLVFDIRRFSLDDGPGIRTTVFLKGCSLACIWCHNPESMSADAEIIHNPSVCIQCGECFAVCPEGAVLIPPPSGIDRTLCTGCGKCVEVCPSTALRITGGYYPPDSLVMELLKDKGYFETSGGGVTFSGGEPCLYSEYLNEVMRLLKAHGIPVAIQTAGLFDLAEFREKILPHLDLIYFDLKLFDSWRHREYTGTGNGKIWDNFIALAGEKAVELIPRVPLVPGITADRNNLSGLAGLIRDAGCRQYELLPYHPGGIAKWRALGKPVPHCLPQGMMSPEEEHGWKAFFGEKIGRESAALKQRPRGSSLWLYQ